MPNLSKDALFLVIKSLTKAEKRYFMVNHAPKNSDVNPLYVQLFQALDKMQPYDEERLLIELNLKKTQLSNLKRQLYHHVLEALRQLHTKNSLRLEIRQHIDHAQVLYDKGLYQQSLILLDRAKQKATNFHEIELKMQVLEFEKVIEARHITRSIKNRADQLAGESTEAVSQLSRLSHLSNLALNMYGQYIKNGHVRTEKEAEELRTYFRKQAKGYNLIDSKGAKPDLLSPKNLSFYEKVNLYQAHSWYAYILQDFVLYYRYVQKWVHLFEAFPEQKEMDTALYLKALNNLLTAHFFNNNGEGFKRVLNELEVFWSNHHQKADKNTKILAFVYRYTAKFNRHFMEGTFTQGLYLVDECRNRLKIYGDQIDNYRILIFYYKIASLYFGSGDNASAIRYLNKIVNLKIGSLKSDIQCFARILLLIAHYELKNFDLLEYLIPSVTHFLEKNKEISEIIYEILRFLKRFDRYGFRGLTKAFADLKGRLIEVTQDPFERRFFLYLDIISWLESKIQNRPVEKVIREKYLKGLPRI